MTAPERRGFHPDDTDLAFVTRWNTLVAALLVEPSIKLVARTVVDYGLTDEKRLSVYPGNERIARQTGYSARQVQEAWHFLRATEMAIRENRAVWTGKTRLADLYQLDIPATWRWMAVLGPNSKRFTCQQCGKVFNPSPVNCWRTDKYGKPIVNGNTGLRHPMWTLPKAVFCPAPRGRRQSPCQVEWQRANCPWGELDNDAAWDLFRKARDDDWPALS